MRKVLVVVLYVCFVIVILPAGITFTFGNVPDTADLPDITDSGSGSAEVVGARQLKVLNSESQEVIETEFEEYIIGVVAAEMPPSFHEEALKAQAVAARTYAYKRVEESQNLSPDEIAEVYDIGQAYSSVAMLREKWGDQFDAYYGIIRDAVLETKGEIMIYDDEPIEAVFHSSSAGMTEAAENVWQISLPYLQSVPSAQDENAPGFESEKRFSKESLVNLFESKGQDLGLTEQELLQQMHITERTEAGYVKTAQVGNQVFSGREVRELLGLRSSNFTFYEEGDEVVFVTKGYGHGAGMSQYGAHYMAQSGYSYEEILSYYYKGIMIIEL